MTVPSEYAADFVAEVFEDPERSISWDDVVDNLVSETDRGTWDQLSACDQLVEVLRMADRYDKKAVELLSSIDSTNEAGVSRRTFDDAIRLRRNADMLRDGIASAYGSRVVDDETLTSAVETASFRTKLISTRESHLKRVADQFEFTFRPYGGTLLDESGSVLDTERYVEW